MTEKIEDKTFDLEEQLLDFAVRIVRMAEFLPKPTAAYYNDWISGPN
jgi:hypothetical protein